MISAMLLTLLVHSTPAPDPQCVPGPLPDRNDPLPYSAWTTYAERTLRSCFPEHGVVIDDIRFEILPTLSPEIMTQDSPDGQAIKFALGLIRSVESPAEFSVQLGHELAHAVKNHSFRDFREFRRVVFGPDPNLILEVISEEVEADLFAAARIAGGACAVHRNNERNYPLWFENGQPPERALLQMDVRREMFRVLCEYETRAAAMKKEEP